MTTGSPSAPRPHRGVLVLVLGILGLVLCMPLGIAAWVMGNADLAAMARGEMDRTGEGMTQAGKVCGIISVVLAALGIVLVVLLLAVGVFAASQG